MTERRRFIATAGGVVAAAAAAIVEGKVVARAVHASFAKFQTLVGPWDHAAEGAYHRLVAT